MIKALITSMPIVNIVYDKINNIKIDTTTITKNCGCRNCNSPLGFSSSAHLVQFLDQLCHCHRWASCTASNEFPTSHEGYDGGLRSQYR